MLCFVEGLIWFKFVWSFGFIGGVFWLDGEGLFEYFDKILGWVIIFVVCGGKGCFD